MFWNVFWALGCSSEIEAKVAHEKANLFDIVSIVPEFKTLLLWSKMFFQNLSHKSLWKTSQRRRVGLCNILQRYDDDIFSYRIIVWNHTLYYIYPIYYSRRDHKNIQWPFFLALSKYFSFSYNFPYRDGKMFGPCGPHSANTIFGSFDANFCLFMRFLVLIFLRQKVHRCFIQYFLCVFQIWRRSTSVCKINCIWWDGNVV